MINCDCLCYQFFLIVCNLENKLSGFDGSSVINKELMTVTPSYGYAI